MSDILIQWFQTHLGGIFSGEVITFIISMMPFLELRGGMIAASLFNIPYLEACLICLAGNLLPIPFVLLLITPIFKWLKTTKLFRPLVEWVEGKAMGKADRVQNAEFIGLMLFVGIPLPGTGAWTGSIIAAMLGVKFKKAIVAEIIGLFIALAIMSVLTYLIPGLFFG